MDTQGIITGSFGEISNRADWIVDVELKDASTNELFDISAISLIEVQVQDKNNTSLLSATTTNGKVIEMQDGIFRFSFTASEMATLKEDVYSVGIRITVSGVIYPLFNVTISVIEGHVI